MRRTPSTSSARPRLRLLAALAAASMAVTGAVAVAAQADPVTVEPTPTLTPRPTATPAPSYGTFCADPAPGAVATYYEVTSVTSTAATVEWSMGFGCFRMGITAQLEVDGNEYATSVGGPFTLSGGFTVTGLEPGSTHTLKVTAAEYDSAPRTLGGSEITTPLTDPTPAPGTPIPSPGPPTPTPTPGPPSPSPTPFPSPESIVDHIDVLDLTPTSATLSWGDTVADPLYYLVTVSGYPDIPTQREGSTRLTNLTPGTTYNVRVFSRGGYVFFPGFDTFAIQFTTPTVGGPIPTPGGPTPSPSPTGGTVCNEIGPPTSEIRYRILQVTPTTARIFYHYGAGCFLAPVTGTYEVDGQVRATLTGFSGIYTITGLEPGSTHRVKITGNAGGSEGGPRLLADLTITTPLVTSTPVPSPTLAPSPSPSPVAPTPGIDPPIPYSYGLTGSATLKTLTKGSLPLSGGIDAKLTLPSGDFTGDLTLGQSTGKLTALGFLPVTAKVNLVSTDKVTGSLKDGKLTAVAKVRIKLPSVKALGIELAGGANCQAKQISSITLTSTQAKFMPLSGGPIAGTFSISDLSGCGFLTGIVSPLTQGGGNLIALNLTPKPITP